MTGIPPIVRPLSADFARRMRHTCMLVGAANWVDPIQQGITSWSYSPGGRLQVLEYVQALLRCSADAGIRNAPLGWQDYEFCQRVVAGDSADLPGRMGALRL